QQTEFIGQIQRLATAAQSDIPAAFADLDRMVRQYDDYIALHAPAARVSTNDTDSGNITPAPVEAAPPKLYIDWKLARHRNPARAPDSRLLSLSIEEVLNMRPDLEPLLSTPIGTLIAFDPQGIAAVLDPHDQDLWPSVRPTPEAVQSQTESEN